MGQGVAVIGDARHIHVGGGGIGSANHDNQAIRTYCTGMIPAKRRVDVIL